MVVGLVGTTGFAERNDFVKTSLGGGGCAIGDKVTV
jgi:hypothetical protein